MTGHTHYTCDVCGETVDKTEGVQVTIGGAKVRVYFPESDVCGNCLPGIYSQLSDAIRALNG